MEELLRFGIVGVVTGAIYAVTASGLVVTYTTSGIFNFAHGAIGMLGAFVYWQLRVDSGWPAPLALVFVLFVFAPLFGAVVERVLMRPLHGASLGTSLVVTLGLFVILLGGSVAIWSPNEARTLPEFFLGDSIKLAGVVVTYHQIITIVTAGVVAVFLRLLLFRTRVGTAMRAVVDDRELAAMNGASPARVSQLSWVVGSVLAVLAGILLAPLLVLDQIVLTLLVVNGYAAAMVGRLKSLPLTFAGALALGLIESYAIGYMDKIVSGSFGARLRPSLPTIFLFIVLLVLPQARLRSGRLSAGKTPRVPGMRESVAAGTVFVVVAFVASRLMSDYWLSNVGQGLALGIICLSLVVLVGYGGQVSLCQLTFVGMGAFAMGKFFGGGSILGIVAAGVLAGIVGAIVALPALRLQGLYLALSTLAFALLAENLFFKDDRVFGLGASLGVGRLFVDSERDFFVVLAAAFALGGVFVLFIRRGPFGRLLSATGDSPAACATLGLDLTRTKLTVFALSAAMAGIGGALYGGLRTQVTQNDFIMLQSLLLLLWASVGGINTVSGALVGGMVNGLLPVLQGQFKTLGGIAYIVTGGVALSLGRNPNGLVGLFTNVADRFRAAEPEDEPAREEIPLDEVVGKEVETLAGVAG